MRWTSLCELQEWIALATFERREVACGPLACSTVAPRRERDDWCLSPIIVVYRFDDLCHSHPLIQIQSDPLSCWFRVFLISRLEPLAKVHAPEAGRHAHVMTTSDVRPQLDFATDFV